MTAYKRRLPVRRRWGERIRSPRSYLKIAGPAALIAILATVQVPAAEAAPTSSSGVSWLSDAHHTQGQSLAPIGIGLLLILVASTGIVATVWRRRHKPTRVPSPVSRMPATPALPIADEVPDSAASCHEILLLGPPVVTGTSKAAPARAQELLLLLALDENHHALKDDLRGRLCTDPDEPMSDGYFRQTCTRVREWLGPAGDGRPYLVYTGGGYTLHAELGVDWDYFQILAEGDNVEDLRRALALVRGEPLEGCCYCWLDPLTVASIRARIVEVAEHLGLTELARGEPRRAAWAAYRGLLADPYAEELFRVLMRAEHDSGDTYGVHLTYERWLQKLATIETAPHPATVALYRKLTRPAPPVAVRYDEAA